MDGFSRGSVTEIRVTDKEGNPVDNAGIYYNGMMEFPIMVTDRNGIVRSDVFTDMAPGNVVTLQASKDGLLSNIFRFTVSEPASGLKPQALSISFDDSPSVLRFNYMTPPTHTGTIIQFVEKSKFNGNFNSAASFNGTDSESYIIDQNQPVMVRTHSVSVKGLKPGVTYVYRFKDGAGRVSETYELVWPDTSKPYSFLFLTDPQAYNAASYAVYGNALERAYAVADNPAFVILGGDMVDRGNNRSQWDMFFEYSLGVFARLPMMAAPGNHETYDDKELANYRAYLGLPENGPEGYEETAYSFETDNALFMVLNTQKALQPQLDWMQKRWIHSQEVEDCSDAQGAVCRVLDETELSLIAPVMTRWESTWCSTDMTIYIAHHERRQTTPGNGTTYITGGSSANKYYDAENRPWTQVLFDDNKPVFTLLNVLSDRISITSYHIDNGKTVVHDRFDIKK